MLRIDPDHLDRPRARPECVQQIARYRDLGFTQVSLRLFYPEMTEREVLEHIELVGRQVLPEVHRL